MANIEIERKFLPECLPENLSEYEVHQIEQGYLCTDPVVRIRRSDETCYLVPPRPPPPRPHPHSPPARRPSHRGAGHLRRRSRAVDPGRNRIFL